MNKCVNCNILLEEDAYFCSNCGTEITYEEPINSYCSNCGNELDLEDTFCGHCGKNVKSHQIPEKKPTRKKRRSSGKRVKNNYPSSTKRKKRSIGSRMFRFLFFVGIILFTLLLIPESWYESIGEDLSGSLLNDETIKEVSLHAVTATIVPEPSKTIDRTVTSSGSEIINDAIRVSIPHGAVEGEKIIQIKKILGSPPTGLSSGPKAFEAVPIGSPYDIGPGGISFEKPVTFTLAYDPASLPKEISTSSLILSYYDGQKWLQVDAYHDKVNHSFTSSASDFPGSLFHILGIPIIVVGGTYMIATGKHKKVYQMIWDPIRRGWIHEMIKPKEKSVQDYSKRLRINDGGDLVSLDNMDEFENTLEKLIKKNNSVPFGFVDKYNKKKFIELTNRYDKDAEFVKKPEDYIGKIDKTGKFGDCIDVTNIYVSMLRAKGIQAKGVAGYTVGGGPHAWVEVVIGTEVYVVDEYARLAKRDEYTKFVKYPKPGDSYRKMWDENGTSPYVRDWYKPVINIGMPSGKIHAQDGIIHSFTVNTLGIPENALFSWNYNKVGYSIPSRKKPFSYKFEATGTFTLTCRAKWGKNELTKTINFTVYGKEDEVMDIASCRNKKYHLSTPDEDVDLLLMMPEDLHHEAEKFIGKSLTQSQKDIILDERRSDFNEKASYYRKILPRSCYEAVKKFDLWVIWDGVYLDHRKGTSSTYYKGYKNKDSSKQDTEDLPVGTNPYSDYQPKN